MANQAVFSPVQRLSEYEDVSETACRVQGCILLLLITFYNIHFLLHIRVALFLVVAPYIWGLVRK